MTKKLNKGIMTQEFERQGFEKQGSKTKFGVVQYKELNIIKAEVWNDVEISKLKEMLRMDKIGSYISKALWDNELELKEIPHIVSYINSKRCFAYEIDGKFYKIVIPSDREITEGVINADNAKLLKLAMTYYDWKHMCPETNADKKTKKDLWEKFVYLKKSIGYSISARLFSKKFKDKYKMSFIGITGVALTGNLGIDECAIPSSMARELGINKGDYVLAIRHPFQNITLTLKVRKLTYDETVRVNSLVFTWLGGDHDGDKVNIVPIKALYFNNEGYFDCKYSEFADECMKIQPSKVLEQSDNPLYENIKAPSEENKGFRTISTLDMLEESTKSEKFAGEVTEQDYIDNQYSTVLNMRTVKEGTAFAGAFCNWLMEVCHLHGGLDERLARRICDLIQQTALDSKHNSATGKGYTGEVWYQITELRRNCKGLDRATIAEKLINILNGQGTLSDDDIDYSEVLD